VDQNSPIIVDGIKIPIGHTLRGRPAYQALPDLLVLSGLRSERGGSAMRPFLLDSRVGKHPAAEDAAKSWEVDPTDYAAAWLAERFQVPAALAETIATLAGLGGRSP
jgi:hypothetical protein